MTPTATSLGKRKRSHTFGGCGTCRRRHVKCDQVRPMCLTCQAIGAECEGYRNGLRWISDSAARTNVDNVPLSARAHLYTEKSRVTMSLALQEDIGDKPIEESLADLDAKFKDGSAGTSANIAVGPFGVFPLSSKPGVLSRDLGIETEETNATYCEAKDITPHTVESFGSIHELSDWLDWPDLFELDFDFPEMPTLDADVASLNASNFEFAAVQSSSPISILRRQLPQANNAPSPTGPETDQSMGWPQELDLKDVKLLIRHFQNNVIPRMVSMPMRHKSTWNSQMVSSGVLALAKLTYLNSTAISKAALVNLLALCAISARHLASQIESRDTDVANHWHQFAGVAMARAKEALKWSLQNETRGLHVAKYKEQVMALSTMLAFASDAHIFMVDAERLLRVRGLAKREISRKTRQLHHIYTWVRVLGESTYVLRNYEKAELRAAIDVGGNARKTRRTRDKAVRFEHHHESHNPRLDDFLRLKPGFNSEELELEDWKNREAGLQDIHLEDSREWSETMYIELYGISETWLSLVSQTTRLANVLDCAAANRERKDIEILESLERRKARLENKVCSFSIMDAANDQDKSIDLSFGISSCAASPRACMVRALNSALVIYFYRRIRNVNPLILQEHVNNVMTALKDFDNSCQRDKILGPGSPWPAFLAGCEARSASQREFFVQWFESARLTTGFPRFKAAKSCMKEIWDRQSSELSNKGKEQSDQPYSWMRLFKERGIHLLLS